MAFNDDISQQAFSVNLVIKITTDSGDTYFSKYDVASGLSIDTDKRGVIDSFKVSPSQIDIQRAKQPFANATVQVTDKDEVFSAFQGDSVAALSGFDITLYVGTPTADFSEYLNLGIYTIGNIKDRGTGYSVTCRPPSTETNIPIYRFRGTLDASISDSATTIDVNTGIDLIPTASGRGKIENEFIQYTSKSFSAGITTLTGVSRGDLSSTAEAHDAGSEFIYVEEVEDNPINILLQILTSTGDGTNGAYDVLQDGTGIDEDKIDITSFTDIRDTFFSAEPDFLLYLYDIEKAISYIETELLEANNLRFTSSTDGKLALAILDQSDVGVSYPIADSSSISRDKRPGWNLNDTRIVNEVTVQYSYSEGQQQYSRTYFKEDTDSKDKYGIRRGRNLMFKGITSESVAADRAQRYIDRFKTPTVTITSNEFLKNYERLPGSKVNFSHPDLPAVGAGRGLNAELEVLKNAINFATGEVKKTYVFTSYFNIRRGLIGPTNDILAVNGFKEFQISTTGIDSYKRGFVLRLFNPSSQTYLADIPDPIEAIDTTTGIVIMKNGFPSLATGLQIRFAKYNDAATEQTARYAYIVGPSGVFSDGTGAYKIF